MSALTEVLAAAGLCKRFGPIEALRDVSFALAGPGVIGVLGPNGAGKTTLLDLLAGLSEPSAGTLRLFGAPLARGRYPRRRVGVVLQREFVLDGMRAADYAALFAAAQGVREGAAQILAQAGLAGRARVPVERLSGGEAQRLFIAAAAVHDPALLLLDEPTAHLDPAGKAAVGAALKGLGRARTVVISTHDLREADALCEQLLFLVGGQVRACGHRDALLGGVPARGGPRMEEAFAHYCGALLTPDGGLF